MSTLTSFLAPAPYRRSRRRATARFLGGSAALWLGLLPFSGWAKTSWDAIPAEDLSATECKSYPGSSAEVLFQRQTFDASRLEAWSTHYMRIKVYSPKGVEEAGVLGLDYFDQQKVWDLFARVTKPDGSSTEFGKESFNDTLLAKIEGAKWKRKALAVPNLSAGDVVEMQWTQNVFTLSDFSYHWYCQQSVPVREYTFAIEGSAADYTVLYFNVAKAEVKRPSQYQGRLEMRDLPPFGSEPHMPPQKDVRGWFLLVFNHPYLRWYSKPNEMWKLISSAREEDFRLLTKPGSTLKAQAAQIVRGTASDEEKLQRLYDFCQSSVSNLTYLDTSDLQKAKKKLQNTPKQGPDETLKRKSGYAHHINELFAALARAAGFQVRLGLCASRNNTLNVRNPKGWLFINDPLVVVKIGDRWKPYAPGDYYTPAGMIDKANEMASYLRCEEDEVIFEQVPVSPAEKSALTRKGDFQIDAEGNLEGNVEVRMSGHEGSWRKRVWENKQDADINNELQESIAKQLPGAEISGIVWENLRGNALPLVVRYKVKVPGYAEVAGSRIVLTPDYFDHGKPALFSAEQRHYPIFFDHAWAEHDNIEIVLPEGFSLEAPSAPADVGDPSGALGVRYQVAYKPKHRRLSYHRDFALGGNGAIAFQAASYPAIKALTDAITRSDEHSLVLKPKPAAPPSDTAPAGGAH